MKDVNLFRVSGSIFLRSVSSKGEVLRSDDCDGYLIDSKESEVRRIVQSLKGSGKTIAVRAQDDFFNRRVIETLRVDYLVFPERVHNVGTLKQRDSGINHVVAKIAVKNKVCILIDVFSVSKFKGISKSRKLEQLIQNVKVCRKAGCEIKIASLTFSKKGLVDEKARGAIGFSLGMSSSQVKGCTNFD